MIIKTTTSRPSRRPFFFAASRCFAALALLMLVPAAEASCAFNNGNVTVSGCCTASMIDTIKTYAVQQNQPRYPFTIDIDNVRDVQCKGVDCDNNEVCSGWNGVNFTYNLVLIVPGCVSTPSMYEDVCAEEQPGFRVCKSISDVNGWGPMTNDDDQPDLTNWHTGEAVCNSDAGNAIVIGETPHSGVQSWQFKRGYDSAGPNTGCSPPVASDTRSGTFEYSVWFKSADAACSDGSRISVVPAPADCSDRSNLYLELKNDPINGLQVLTYEHSDQSTWSGDYKAHPLNLDCDKWHELKCSVVEDEATHNVKVDCSVDGETLDMGDVPYFTRARQKHPFPYTPSHRVKFQPRHPNHDASKAGFLFDDLRVSKEGASGESDSYFTSFESAYYVNGTVCKSRCKGGVDADLTCINSAWSGVDGECDVDCEGAFGDFGACSDPCGGFKSRLYEHTTLASHGGKQCPHPEGYEDRWRCNVDKCLCLPGEGAVFEGSTWIGCELCEHPEHNNETSSAPCAEIACPVGMEASHEGKCVPCAPGYYSDSKESGQCMQKHDCDGVEVAKTQTIMPSLCCSTHTDTDCTIKRMTEYVDACKNVLNSFSSDTEANIGKMRQRVESLEGIDAAWF